MKKTIVAMLCVLFAVTAFPLLAGDEMVGVTPETPGYKFFCQGVADCQDMTDQIERGDYNAYLIAWNKIYDGTGFVWKAEDSMDRKMYWLGMAIQLDAKFTQGYTSRSVTQYTHITYHYYPDFACSQEDVHWIVRILQTQFNSQKVTDCQTYKDATAVKAFDLYGKTYTYKDSDGKDVTATVWPTRIEQDYYYWLKDLNVYIWGNAKVQNRERPNVDAKQAEKDIRDGCALAFYKAIKDLGADVRP